MFCKKVSRKSIHEINGAWSDCKKLYVGYGFSLLNLKVMLVMGIYFPSFPVYYSICSIHSQQSIDS